MTTLVRRLKGVFVSAILWSFAWAVAGLLAGLLLLIPGRAGWDTLRTTVLLFALVGLVSGTVFSILLTALYRSRSVGDLRAGRVGLLGTVGAMALTFVLAAALIPPNAGADTPADEGIFMLIAGGLGWASAAGAVRIAQYGTDELGRHRPTRLAG